MSGPRIGSLFSGYGGLDLAAAHVLGAEVIWHSEIDPGALKILNHHYPDVPNLGDVTAVDWDTVEPVDVLTGGYPCQPFSHAGRRKGTNDDRHLWPHVRDAVRHLRPRYTVLENVAGHRSLGFDRVLGDLAEDGFHVRWTSLRAADVGAPHGRERVFILVTPPDTGREPGQVPDRRRLATVSVAGSHGATGRIEDLKKPGGHGPPLAVEVEHLLPTPAVNDMGAGKTVEHWDAWTERMRAKHGNGNGHGKSLAIEAQRLLPTPVGGDSRNSRQSTAPNPRSSHDTLSDVNHKGTWREYAAAIARWEHTLGRPAPAPTQTSAKGNPQLSPAFVEWMMGLPAGWVSDVPGLTMNKALKALGNGVVPQQAAAALVDMLTWDVAA